VPEPAGSWDQRVRRVDFDRYLSSLFAPNDLRAQLNVLYAFNFEVAKVAETVSNPIAGQIRLQWWRDRIKGLYGGEAVDHPLARALGRVIAAHDLPRALFDTLIDVRERDLEDVPFATLADLEDYADATSGHVMRLAARILGADDSLDADARGFGVAYALAGLCRALPYHAARRRIMLPADRLAARSLSVEDVFSGASDQRLRSLIADMAERAHVHLHARRRRIERRVLPALLPAALAPLYLRAVTKPGFDPLHDVTDLSVPRRQLAMLGAMIRGRL